MIRQGEIGEALQYAQEELAPRGEEHTQYLGELERTMALLAFDTAAVPNAVGAPAEIAELLLPEQRMKTASELNTAILESLSQSRESKLMGLTKLLVWGESMLSQRAEFPKVWTVLWLANMRALGPCIDRDCYAVGSQVGARAEGPGGCYDER